MKFSHAEFKQWWNALSEEQKDRVRAKAQWEHMSLSAVRLEWPGIENAPQEKGEVG